MENLPDQQSWIPVIKKLASDAEECDMFGQAVAICGGTAVVGAHWEDSTATASNGGAVYVFDLNRDGPDQWGEIKKLTAGDTAMDDEFGRSVAISGDTIVVGAPYKDDDGNASGAAYIFGRNTGGADNWGMVRKLTASDAAALDSFGSIVAISGDTVVVGAGHNDRDKDNADTGAAYIFSRNTGGADNWGEVKKLTAGDSAASDYFGRSLAISRDTLVVGAPWKDDGGTVGAGAVYIFSRNNGGLDNWGEDRKLLATNVTANERFGSAVAIGDNTLVVGTAKTKYSEDHYAGAAYVFDRNQGGADKWGEVKVLMSRESETEGWFGGTVSISGDTAAVGAPGKDDANMNAGAAYLFSRNEGGADNWGEVQKLVADDPKESHYFSISLAVSSGTIIVGARGDDEVARWAGAAYIFAEQGDLVSKTKRLAAGDVEAQGNFGVAVGVSGQTAVAGADWNDEGGNNAGAAYIYSRNLGDMDKWGMVKKLRLSDSTAVDIFGYAVSVSGNTIVVGAPYRDQDGGVEDAGAAYIFSRNKDGKDNWGLVEKLVASDGLGKELFGYAVAVSDDTIVVGAEMLTHAGGNKAGAAYVFSRNEGGADNWGEVKKLIPNDSNLQDSFGRSVAISGDTAVVGAQGAQNHSGGRIGAAYIFSRNEGGANNWGQVRKLIAGDAALDRSFGCSVAIDAHTVVAGDSGGDQRGVDAGAAYIFSRNHGGMDNWGQVKMLTAADAAANDNFGYSVAVNGGRILVGATLGGDGGIRSGAAYLFGRNEGGADNWGQVQKLADAQAGALFGNALAMSHETVVVGARQENEGAVTAAGGVYIYQS